MKSLDITSLDWSKENGLIPAIIQDSISGVVLMLGYMNEAALKQTLATGLVTFYSRSKQRLWTKGETSGHTLQLVTIHADCDQDALLILAKPKGPTCHFNTTSCFNGTTVLPFNTLTTLEQRIVERTKTQAENSYTAKLYQSGTKRVAQKVGEEGLEIALAAVCETPEKLAEESADLLYHLLVLLFMRDLSFSSVLDVLKNRMTEK